MNIRPRIMIVALTSAFTACDGDGISEPEVNCTPQVQQYVASTNAFTPTGAPVAVFRANQEHTTYPGGSQCGPLGGPVTLTITGSAPIPIRFDYIIQGLGATGLVVWSYEGSIPRIVPGESNNVGLVATTPVRVNIGVRVGVANVQQVP
jgi:hypothetical protein